MHDPKPKDIYFKSLNYPKYSKLSPRQLALVKSTTLLTSTKFCNPADKIEPKNLGRPFTSKKKENRTYKGRKRFRAQQTQKH